MGCCNEPVTTLTGLSADPTQHVNYERGMVLGVDDFRQEFAYHDGRDRWLARDAIGYGTLAGLRVHAEDDGTEGPRLHVSAGSALVPGGRLVCVPGDQCATLNRWLARPENAALVGRLLSGSPPLSPPASGTAGPVALHLVLCWADCTTRPVPIPGEPCRSEDALMKDSRVADDYRLELRETAPAQQEEDALVDFVRWLRANVVLQEDSPVPPADEQAWLAALRQAVQPWADAEAASPPLSPPPSVQTLGDYLFDLSPAALALAPADLPQFLRLAQRFWVTELRPRWMAMRCHAARQPDTDCLLLARIVFTVEWVGGSPSGAWQVVGNALDVQVDESRRPVLAPARLLQEWALFDRHDPAPGVPVSALPMMPPVTPVEAGGTGLDTAPADGQLLVGSGGGYALASLSGTAAQVSVTTGPGSIRLSLPQSIATGSTPMFAGLTTTGAMEVAVALVNADLALTQRHHVLICSGGQSLQLPKCNTANRGRTYVVKSVGSDSKVLPAAGDAIDGPTATPGTVKKGNAKTLVSDGKNTWHVLATVA